MLVSILIPVYNAEKYLNRTINSIIVQDYEDIEIILFDDASKDSSRNIMIKYSEKYPDKIFSHWTNENGGIGKSKNMALSFSKGDYVFFMDCDDYISDKHYISNMVSKIDNSDADIIISGFSLVDDYENIIHKKRFQDTKEAFFQSTPLFGKLYRRRFLDKYNIKSTEGRIILEDVLYQAALFSCNPFCKTLDFPEYCWVQHSMSTSKSKLKGFEDDSFYDAMLYLDNFQNNSRIENKERFVLGIFQYYCWHILKLGVNVSTKDIIKESNAIMSYMKNYIEFKKGNFFEKGFKPIVYIVMCYMYFLYSISIN